MCKCIITNKEVGLRKYDPTHTTMLRNSFVKDMKKRFSVFKSLVVKAIRDFGIFDEEIVINQLTPINSDNYRNKTDAEKIALFMLWLREQQDKGILEIVEMPQLGTAVETAWTNKYIQLAYDKGVKRATAEVIKLGFAIDDTFAKLSTFPVHVDTAGIVFTRTYSELKGITENMDMIISRKLAEGIIKGDSPKVVAKEISSVVDVSMKRASVMARTEMIRAHHLATIQQYENLGMEHIKVRAEYATAGDSYVCPDCAYLNGKVFTLDEIRGVIPLHPNCRCVSLVFMEHEDVPKMTNKQINATISFRYRAKDGSFKRRGFYEKITGKPLEGAPKPNVKIDKKEDK